MTIDTSKEAVEQLVERGVVHWPQTDNATAELLTILTDTITALAAERDAHAARADAAEAEVARRLEMHECAMAERDDCIEDWSKAKMAEAVHDGPLGADDHWFSAARPQGAWCVDVVRAALRAIGGDA